MRNDMEDVYARYVIPGDPDACWRWGGYIGQKGYGYVHINSKDWIAPRLSYTINYGPIPEGMHVCHRCDNPACVNPHHLFLGTAQDNATDKVRKGRQPRGERNGGVKLTDAKVVLIKSELAERTGSNSAIAKRYGVTRKTIDAIEHGRTWAHIPGPAPTRKALRNALTGSNHPNAKLTEDKVIEIRRLIAEGKQTQGAIALHFGVSESLISSIKLNRIWRVQTVSTGAITSSKELSATEAAILIRELEIERKEKQQPAANGKVHA